MIFFEQDTSSAHVPAKLYPPNFDPANIVQPAEAHSNKLP